MTEKVDKLISIDEFKTDRSNVHVQRMLDSIENMKQVMKILSENKAMTDKFNQQIAADKKSKYDAYIAVGFDPKQALELCK